MKVTYMDHGGKRWGDIEQLIACLRAQKDPVDSLAVAVIVPWLEANYGPFPTKTVGHK